MSLPEPLGENVLLERIDDYDGYIRGVDPMLRDRQGLRARVLAVGPGKPLPDGTAAPMQVREGDVVLIGRALGAELSYAGRPLVAIRESDLMAVFEQ